VKKLIASSEPEIGQSEVRIKVFPLVELAVFG